MSTLICTEENVKELGTAGPAVFKSEMSVLAPGFLRVVFQSAGERDPGSTVSPRQAEVPRWRFAPPQTE